MSSGARSRESFLRSGCFVAGSAKSGTTLLVALLDGHPDLLVIPEETAYFPTVRRKFRNAPRPVQAAYLMEKAEVRLLFEEEAVDRGNRDYRSFPRQKLREEFLARVGDPARAGDDLLALFAESLAAATGREASALRWWIEKTPANRWCVPDIRATYPEGRLLVTMRDPRAVAASVLRRAREKSFAGYSHYLCVKYWVQSAKLFLQEKGNPLTHLVRYEDLLADPRGTMQAVASFLGVGFHEALEVPTKAGKAWRGNSTMQADGSDGVSRAGSKARFSEVSTAPLDNWRKSLPEPMLEFVEHLCGEWMERVGYRRESGKTSARCVLRRQEWETAGAYLKDRRRYFQDLLAGFWDAGGRSFSSPKNSPVISAGPPK